MADRDSDRPRPEGIERRADGELREPRVPAAELADAIHGSASSPPVAGGLRRWSFIVLGCVFTGLGGIGVVLPGIPTTPFLLVASYFFIRSSPRLHAKLLSSKTFGPVLRDWQKHRGLNRRVKWIAMAGCTVAVALSVAFGGLPWPARIVVALAGAYGVWFVARLPEVPDEASR